jgi:integration host factor subunit alpha
MRLTRRKIAKAIYGSGVDLSSNECRDLVDQAIAEITIALVLGETVGISRFGSFTIRRRDRRFGRNPKTGEEVVIQPHRVLVFRPSNALKRKVNA